MAATKSNRDKVFKKYKGRCFYCDIELTLSGGNMSSDFSFDHLKPSKRGGKDTLSNIVASCNGCNVRKGQRTLKEYLAFLSSKEGVSSKLYGKIGGYKTLKKYGKAHFKRIAKL